MRPLHSILFGALLPAGCGDDAGVATTDGSTTSSSSTSEGESSSETTMESSTSSSESSSTTGPIPCVSDEECKDAEAPFCEPLSGLCVACDATEDPDGACAGVDPLRPLCVGDTCVACTPENPLVCDEQLLLCDGGTNACVPCTEHGQCGSGACELAVGTCFPGGLVVHVDGDDYELPSVAAAAVNTAVAYVGAGQRRVIIVHELDDSSSYGPVVIDGGKTVAQLAADGEAPMVQGFGGNLGIRVEDVDTAVYLDGISIRGSGGLGLRVDGAFAWVDRSRIVQNSGGGVLAENGAELTLRNCFVGRNGDNFADTRGVTATGAALDIRYTTIAANDGTGASGPISMSCDAASTGEVRNSIVAAGDDTIACANVSFSFNVVDTMGLTGSDNDVLSFDALGWFPNIAMSDFHIAMGPPFAGVAQWQAGDPLNDIDGDPRPGVDATPDYAGADVP